MGDEIQVELVLPKLPEFNVNGIELLAIFQTEMKNQTEFFTDSNGFGFVPRSNAGPIIRPHQLYPVTKTIGVRNEEHIF